MTKSHASLGAGGMRCVCVLGGGEGGYYTF